MRLCSFGTLRRCGRLWGLRPQAPGGSYVGRGSAVAGRAVPRAPRGAAPPNPPRFVCRPRAGCGWSRSSPRPSGAAPPNPPRFVCRLRVGCGWSRSSPRPSGGCAPQPPRFVCRPRAGR
ncbi:hypothetical protein FE633_44810, partial [Streptomyces montanus]